MVKVLKKRKKKQTFSPAKLKRSIEKAAREAKSSQAKIKKLIEEVANPVIALTKKKRVIKTTDIRRLLLGRLERRARSVSNAWRKYEKKKRK